MNKDAKLLWVDLEMTGLDPTQDHILEIAAIVTDWNFKELGVYEAVQHIDEAIMETRMVGEFWNKFPKVKAELLKQNQSGENKNDVQDSLLAFLDDHFDNDKPVILAGNSIHQDRKFIEREWKAFDKRLHYRMLDVSAWKIVFEGKYKKKFAKPEAHRALEDIRGSIEELQYYLGKVRLDG